MTNVPKKGLVEPKETSSDKWEDFLALLQEDLPDPEKGDQLFTSGGDWEHEVMFFPLSDDWNKWEWYALGYLRAGEVLVEYAKENGHDLNFLVYPIVFLYRQYLELRLKELIRNGKLLFNEPLDLEKLLSTHKFSDLWKDCRPLLEKLATTKVEEVAGLIEEFAKVDPRSDMFRFSTSRDGRRLSKDLRLNIGNFAEVMGKLRNFFEGVSELINISSKGDCY